MKKGKQKHTNSPHIDHTRDLCTDTTPYKELNFDNEENQRRIQQYQLAGDTPAEIKATEAYKNRHNKTIENLIFLQQTIAPHTKRFSPQAMVQFVHEATKSFSKADTFLNSFKIPHQLLKLTKQEKKLTTTLYKLGRAQAQRRITNTLHSNEKMSANMKLLAEINNIPTNTNSNPSNQPQQQQAAQLNIALTKKKQKAKRDDSDNTPQQQTKPQPLDLDIN